MSETNAHSQVPGQGVLTGMADLMGYETIVLKPDYERFVREYVLGHDNGTKAAMLVWPHLDAKAAGVKAARLIGNDNISARIEQYREELHRRYAVTADDVIQYHSRVMKIDRRDYIDDKLKPRNLSDIDPEAATVLEFETVQGKKGGTVTLFKIPQRHQSAVELARILGLHKDGLKLSGSLDGKSDEDLQQEAEKLAQLIVAGKQGSTE